MQGRIRIERDENPEQPDIAPVAITYMARSRYILGTEGVTPDRAAELQDMLDRGEIIGIPVYAYVHSGSTVRCSENGNPFSCPWDSARSGLAYMTSQDAYQMFHERGDGTQVTDDNTMCTERDRETAKAYIRGTVTEFDQWLTGEVYGFIVDKPVEDPARPGEQMIDENEDPEFDENVDSCWGFYGRDYRENGMLAHIQEYLDKGYRIEEV